MGTRVIGVLVAAMGWMAVGISHARAELAPIVIDGRFQDWDSIEPFAFDTTGDGRGGVDFTRLWLADDARRLFLRMELSSDIHLDERNQIHLYLDSDDDAATGLSVAGIGAEFDVHFGARAVASFLGGVRRVSGPNDLGMVALPSVSGSDFEVAIEKSRLRLGSKGTVRVVLRETGGDQVPDKDTLGSYQMGEGTVPVPRLEEIRSPDDGFVRVVSYNVQRDAPWPNEADRLGRQLRAVDPHIINLQEVYRTPLEDVLETVGSFLPPGPGEAWSARQVHDCVTLSRFPILESWAIDENLAVRLDLTSLTGRELLVVNAHLPCCENDAGRDLEIRHIHQFLRERRIEETPGVVPSLVDAKPVDAKPVDAKPVDPTPFLILGDMNLVGRRETWTLLSSGEEKSGTGADWDGTSLASLAPLHLEDRMAYTWRDRAGEYWPGQLDLFFYTDSVLEPGPCFVLRTDGLSEEQRQRTGVEPTDSDLSDHLLVSADFRPRSFDLGTEPAALSVRAALTLHPNPTRGPATLFSWSDRAGSFTLDVFDVQGRRIPSAIRDPLLLDGRGWTRSEWKAVGDNGLPLPAGRYWLRLRDQSGQSVAHLPITLLR